MFGGLPNLVTIEGDVFVVTLMGIEIVRDETEFQTSRVTL